MPRCTGRLRGRAGLMRPEPADLHPPKPGVSILKYFDMTIDDATLVKVLKALANRKRFRMTQEVAAAGELSCGQVRERFDLSQPTISHHLKILRDAGVLVSREAGQHRFISVNHALIHQIADLLPTGLGPAAVRQRTPSRSKAAV